MIDGLYKAAFQTPLGQGTGTVMLSEGKIGGGDYRMFYTGQYTTQDGHFSASVSTGVHSPNELGASVFGIDKVDIDLVGTLSSEVIVAKGTAPQAPGVTFDVVLTRLAA